MPHNLTMMPTPTRVDRSILAVCRFIRAEALGVLLQHLAVVMNQHAFLGPLERLTQRGMYLHGLKKLEMCVKLDELPLKALHIKQVVPRIPHLVRFLITCSEARWTCSGNTRLPEGGHPAPDSLLWHETYEEA